MLLRCCRTWHDAEWHTYYTSTVRYRGSGLLEILSLSISSPSQLAAHTDTFCFRFQSKAFPKGLSFLMTYMHTRCLIRGWTLCSPQPWLSLWASSPSLEEPSVGKSCERSSSNWETKKKTTSIHTSCCTLEPKLFMTHPENPLSSQYDTSPAVSPGWQLISNKYKRGVKC